MARPVPYNITAIDDRLVIRKDYRWLEEMVATVTISPKFQVVIPKDIREKLGLRPGQKIQAVAYGDRIELIPVLPISEARGLFEGLDTDVPREADRA
jgi:AbrB family looped-hinge helix DNA binding protein